jgi:hypothetical protein
MHRLQPQAIRSWVKYQIKETANGGYCAWTARSATRFVINASYDDRAHRRWQPVGPLTSQTFLGVTKSPAEAGCSSIVVVEHVVLFILPACLFFGVRVGVQGLGIVSFKFRNDGNYSFQLMLLGQGAGRLSLSLGAEESIRPGPKVVPRCPGNAKRTRSMGLLETLCRS